MGKKAAGQSLAAARPALAIPPVILFLLTVFAPALPSFAETTNVFERFSQHFSTNCEIIWQAPTNQLPKYFRIYKRLPPRPFLASVISNAVVLASLQNKEFAKPSTNAFFIWSTPNACGTSFSIFSIKPDSTTISFSSPDQNLSTNDVPDVETVRRRAFEYAARFGLDRAYLIPMSVYAASNATGTDTTLTNGICARGINLVRKLDGVGFFSLGGGSDDVDGFSIEFGSRGRVRSFSLVWPNLEPDRTIASASPEEIISFIRARRFILMPEDGENYFQRIKLLSNARRFTVTGITPRYGEGVLGEMPTNDVPPQTITPCAELEGVAGFGNSNVTVRLLSPVLSPVTVLPPSSTEVAQEKNRQHLQGDSVYADWLASRNMEDRLYPVPECYDYLLEVVKNLSPPIYTNCPDGASFRARLEIYQDGSIGNVAVYGWTNAVYVPMYIQAIKRSHIPRWPAKMHSIVGRDYYIMWLDTGVYPLSPGPG